MLTWPRKLACPSLISMSHNNVSTRSSQLPKSDSSSDHYVKNVVAAGCSQPAVWMPQCPSRLPFLSGSKNLLHSKIKTFINKVHPTTTGRFIEIFHRYQHPSQRVLLLIAIALLLLTHGHGIKHDCQNKSLLVTYELSKMYGPPTFI